MAIKKSVKLSHYYGGHYIPEYPVSADTNKGTGAKVETDKGLGVAVKSTKVTEYSHGAQTGTRVDNSVTFGGGLIVVPEITITLK